MAETVNEDHGFLVSREIYRQLVQLQIRAFVEVHDFDGHLGPLLGPFDHLVFPNDSEGALAERGHCLVAKFRGGPQAIVEGGIHGNLTISNIRQGNFKVHIIANLTLNPLIKFQIAKNS